MAKRFLSMAVLVAVLLSLGITASARWDESYRCTPSLVFSGRSASCSASVVPTSPDATISASMTLYRVNGNGTLSTCATWPTRTGTGYVSLSGTYTSAQSGNTYRLVVSGTVQDSSGTYPVSASVTAVCP